MTSRDAETAYQAFMAMPLSEWLGLLQDLLAGGVLEPVEQSAWERAAIDRAKSEIDL
jgi:hypothetical protein